MHRLEELKVWQKAMNLSVAVYKATATFPPDERFGLTSQIRRSSISIPSNIAEGAGRGSNKEFVHFLKIANGSCYELKTQLILSNRMEFLKDDLLKELIEQITDIEKMSFAFAERLKGLTSNI